MSELLCDFANTYDVDVDAPSPDTIADAASLTRWLRTHELIGPRERADDEDVALAQALRSGLRTAMRRHHDGDDGDDGGVVTGLDETAARLTVRVVFEEPARGSLRLGNGAKAGLARLLVAMADAEADGSWTRLKVCLADECQWAFHDTSKNRSRQWCSMGVCGNRQKTRSYRARQRSAKG